MSLTLARLGTIAASFPIAGGDFESIATVTVGSGGASSIEFTSIPGTYQHLQVRGIGRNSYSGITTNTNLQFNSDTNRANYANHVMRGGGSTVYVAAFTYSAGNEYMISNVGLAANTATANVFGGIVVDILDYANTSKNTVSRALSGFDNNGSGNVVLQSHLWMSTNAVTSLKLTMDAGTILEHTSFALYGIKA